MTLRVLSTLLGVLIFPSFAAEQSETVKLNGGLEATILQVGRSKDHRHVTVTLRIANKGTSTAYLLLVDRPVATDNTGAAFDGKENVAGIADCNNGGNPNAQCLGIPQKNNFTVPLQSFTTIEPNSDPNAGITVSFRLGQIHDSDGPLISFSAHLYLRLVSDSLRDDTLSDSEKYRQFRMMTLSFPPRRVTDAQ